LLRRAIGFGDIAQVDADAVPDGGSAAHAVGEDVVQREVRCGFRVRGAPAFEARFGGGFVRRLRDDQQRRLRGAGLARLGRSRLRVWC
jgi:hypothetical protein